MPATPTLADPTPVQALATALLSDLATLGVEVARVVTNLSKIEDRAAAAAARSLPEPDATPTSLAEASAIGQGIDAATDALTHATPRVTTLSNSFDRIARAVRRTLALARRIEQGWPHPATTADTRRTLLLRQVAQGARQAIRAHANGDADTEERLFKDLNAHLDDPEFTADLLDHPAEAILPLLCRTLGVAPKNAPAPRQQATAPTSPPPPSG